MAELIQFFSLHNLFLFSFINLPHSAVAFAICDLLTYAMGHVSFRFGSVSGNEEVACYHTFVGDCGKLLADYRDVNCLCHSAGSNCFCSRLLTAIDLNVA